MKEQTVSEFIQEFRELPKRLKDSVTTTLNAEADAIYNDLVALSPVDKAEFQQNWRITKSSSPGKIQMYSMRIDNETPYGVFVDQGAEKGAAPWYFPNPKKQPSGKLIFRNGKVWAGGLSPSGFVIGGIIDKTIFINTRRLDRIARNLADGIGDVL